MIPEPGSYTVTYGSRRDKGLVRQENQDQIISFDSSVFGQVFLLADGMGGHEGGAVAANMAITGFKQHFQTLSAKLTLRECLEEACRLTNRDIYDKGNEKDGGQNSLRMGSTLVLCVISAGSYVVAHVGDSRCYVFRDGALIRLTKDHTAVQKMVDAGILTPEDAKNHPDASVLTRALGQRPAIEMEISEPFSLAAKETLLLCSDGLYGYVEEAAIIEKLRKYRDPQAAADALLQLALDAGGHDNISIFVIQAEPSSTKGITEPDFPPEEIAAAPAGEGTLALASQPASQPALQAVPQPVPAVRAQPRAPRNRLRLAAWLIAIAFVIMAAPLIAFLRPDLVPATLREKLIAWGIPLPAQNAVDAAGVMPPAQDPVTTPAAAPLADNSAIQAPPAADTVAQAKAPPSAGPPAGTPVFVVFPPKATAVFMNEVHRYAARIRNAGFEVTEVAKPVVANSVWRSVAVDPAIFAPDHLFLSAVFPAGSEHDAARICHLIPCSEPVGLVPAGETETFRDNFGLGGIAVFAFPRVAATPQQQQQQQPAAEVPAGSPAAKPKE